MASCINFIDGFDSNCQQSFGKQIHIRSAKESYNVAYVESLTINPRGKENGLLSGEIKCLFYISIDGERFDYSLYVKSADSTENGLIKKLIQKMIEADGDVKVEIRTVGLRGYEELSEYQQFVSKKVHSLTGNLPEEIMNLICDVFTSIHPSVYYKITGNGGVKSGDNSKGLKMGKL